MAILTPTIQDALKCKVIPTDGELYLLKELEKNLDDSYKVYFQPYLNGSNPDIIILKKGGGVFIIEVKDWILNHYNYHRSEDKFGIMTIPSKNNQKTDTPFNQVNHYKDLFYDLLIPKLMIKTISNKNCYGIVKCAVFFYNSTHAEIKQKFGSTNINYIKVWGRDSSFINDLECSLNKYNINSLFSDDLYDEFSSLLKPSYHKREEAVRNIVLSKEQKKFSASIPGKHTKIKGIAGSGKSTLIANKAVNIFKRTNSTVLILTYNLTLKNYLHDKISDVRENFPWNKFEIQNFHSFVVNKAREFNIPFSVKNEEYIKLENSINNKFSFPFIVDDFIGRVPDNCKFEGIIIDEGQDFELEWFKILKSCFLKENGEFMIVADEKQNIYSQELDSEKKILTNIKGKWASLSESKRLSGDIQQFSIDFQKNFLKNKYNLDDLDRVQLSFSDINQNLTYKFKEKINNDEILLDIVNYIKEQKLSYNEVTIISEKIEFLRYLSNNFQKKYNVNTITTFETQECYDILYKEYKSDLKTITSNEHNVKKDFEFKLYKIRRMKKQMFWANSGKLKFSTIHSFKGWETDTLIIIVDKNDLDNCDEIIYTAITRAKRNLLIYALDKTKYHEFFSLHMTNI